MEVDARPMACNQPAGHSGCDSVDREWTVKASEVSEPASYRRPPVFTPPKKQNSLLCQRSLVSVPVSGLPGRARSSAHSFYIAGD